MNEIIENAISELQEDIAEAQNKIYLIKNLNINDSVNDEEWYNICRTPLRYEKDILIKLIKNTFPRATDIEYTSSNITFNLYGFNLRIPTYNVKGIYIDMCWKEDLDCPKLSLSSNLLTMEKYFTAKDNKAPWYILAKYRADDNWFYSDDKFHLFFWWFLKYKWKDDHRDNFNLAMEQAYSNYFKETEKYDSSVAEYNQKLNKMHINLLPELRNFSNNIKVDKEAGSGFYKYDTIEIGDFKPKQYSFCIGM